MRQHRRALTNNPSSTETSSPNTEEMTCDQLADDQRQPTNESLTSVWLFTLSLRAE